MSTYASLLHSSLLRLAPPCRGCGHFLMGSGCLFPFSLLGVGVHILSLFRCNCYVFSPSCISYCIVSRAHPVIRNPQDTSHTYKSLHSPHSPNKKRPQFRHVFGGTLTICRLMYMTILICTSIQNRIFYLIIYRCTQVIPFHVYAVVLPVLCATRALNVWDVGAMLRLGMYGIHSGARWAPESGWHSKLEATASRGVPGRLCFLH